MGVVSRGFFGAAFAGVLVLLITLSFNIRQDGYQLVQTASVDGSVPLQQNSLLQFQVPMSELEQAKVGEIVSGQVPYGNKNGQVAFTGQVTNGYGTSASTGSLTVQQMSLDSFDVLTCAEGVHNRFA